MTRGKALFAIIMTTVIVTLSVLGVFIYYFTRNTGDASAVYNGGATSISYYPWLTVLRVDGQFNCGASLIRDDVVLTAGHCVVDENAAVLTPSRLSVIIGQDRPNWPLSTPIRAVSVVTSYNGRTSAHDVALIKLEHGVGAPTVPLSFDKPHPYSDVQVVGWGCDVSGVKRCGHATNLQAMWFKTAVENTCLREVVAQNAHPSFDVVGDICIVANDASVGQGDAGGPLLIRQNGQWVEVGVTSAGFYADSRYWFWYTALGGGNAAWIHTNLLSLEAALPSTVAPIPSNPSLPVTAVPRAPSPTPARPKATPASATPTPLRTVPPPSAPPSTAPPAAPAPTPQPTPTQHPVVEYNCDDLTNYKQVIVPTGTHWSMDIYPSGTYITGGHIIANGSATVRVGIYYGGANYPDHNNSYPVGPTVDITVNSSGSQDFTFSPPIAVPTTGSQYWMTFTTLSGTLYIHDNPYELGECIIGDLLGYNVS